MPVHTRLLTQLPLPRRVAPFVAAALIAFAAIPLGGVYGTAEVGAAVALTLVILAAVALVPWERLPAWSEATPVLAYFGVIVLLRQAEGGAVSGMGTLVLLPVFWLALYGTRTELVVALGLVALAFILPILLIGAPEYPDDEWRRAALWVLLASLVAFAVQQLVQALHRREAEAVRRTAELDAAASASASLVAIVSSSRDAIIGKDLEGTIRSWNQGAERLYGYTAREVIGKSIEVLIPPGRPDEVPALLARIRRGERIESYETVRRRKDGTLVEVELSISPVIVGIEMTGASVIARDISDRRRAESYRRAQHSVASALAESTTTGEAMPRLLAGIGGATGWCVAAFWRPEGYASSAALRCTAVWHTPGARAERYERASIEVRRDHLADLRERVFVGGEAAWLEDAATGGVHAAVCCPVLGHNGALGVIELLSDETGPPSPRLLEVLEAISRQLGQFIERERAEAEAERLKAQFFALVSHELRTPLTSIIGYLDLVKEQEATRLSAPGRDFLDVIDRNAARLNQLVQDLLLVAQVEAGTFHVSLRSADLPAIAHDSVAAAGPRAEQSGVELRLRSDPLPACAGDPERLAQVLDNLVSNAIKFTPAGGRVEVRVVAGDGAAIIEVEDTGQGIPATEQERLFDRFYRSARARDSGVQGVGLGLSIVEAIVDAHSGRIDVESEEGAGTTFRVELPRRPSPDKPTAAPAPEKRGGDVAMSPAARAADR